MAQQQPARPTGTSNARESSRAATAVVNVQLPATIVSYDSSAQRATVRIVPCFKRRDAANGGGIVCYRPPDIPGVPVAFPGAGSWSITWPLTEGDAGLLCICDRSIDEWKSEGGSQSEPQDARRHDLSDGVFVPGVRSFADPIPSAGIDGSALVIRGAAMKLGSSAATKAVALGPDVTTNLAALEVAIVAANAAALLAAVPADGGVAAFTAFQGSLNTFFLTWPTSVDASKVKAE